MEISDTVIILQSVELLQSLFHSSKSSLLIFILLFYIQGYPPVFGSEFLNVETVIHAHIFHSSEAPIHPTSRWPLSIIFIPFTVHVSTNF